MEPGEYRHPGHQEDKGSYIPSPEEIAEETAKIRATWSEIEKQRRLNKTFGSSQVEVTQTSSYNLEHRHTKSRSRDG